MAALNPCRAGRRRALCRAAACLALALLAGCMPGSPVRIGLLADFSGRNARFNVDGRNGALLAAEVLNAAGGIGGRPIELLVCDSGTTPAAERAAVRALLDAGVALVVGPFSSPVAARILPQFDAAGVLLLCPASTDAALAGRDDQLLLLNRSTRASASAYAAMLHGRGHRRLALATDMRNASNNGGWRDAFVQAFTAHGGRIVADTAFGVAAEPTAYAVVRAMLAAGPDGLVFVANGVDTARLAQQAAKLHAALPMVAPDWAEDRSLLEAGGQAVEGLVLASAARLDDEGAGYRGFHQAYLARFGTEPSYRSIAAYDAMTVVARALAQARPGESAKNAVLRQGPYQGLQQSISFDRFGDATRQAYYRVVHGGRFEPLP